MRRSTVRKGIRLHTLLVGGLIALTGCSAGEDTPNPSGGTGSGGNNPGNATGSGGTASSSGGAASSSGGTNSGSGGTASSSGGTNSGSGGTASSSGGTNSGSGGVSGYTCDGPEGTAIGETVGTHSTTDSKGNTFSFRDHCGKVIILEHSSPECGRCTRNARNLPAFAANYDPKDVIFVVSWYEGTGSSQNNGSTPSLADLESFLPTTDQIYSVHMTGTELRRNVCRIPGGTTPGMCMIGRDGRIIRFGNGDEPEDWQAEMEAEIAK